MAKIGTALAALAATGLLVGGAGCGDDGSDGKAAPTTVGTPTFDTGPAPELDGRLVFARFDESTHTLVTAHTMAPDGTGEQPLPMAEPYGGLRFSHDGRSIAVAVALDDGRVGTGFKTPAGTIDRTLPISDPTLNLYCYAWSPDDSHLACEGWDDSDDSRHGIYEVAAADGSGLHRLDPAGSQLAAGDYSPDGSVLVVKDVTGEDSEGNGRLHLLHLDGTQELTPLGELAYENAGRFSPDGQRIATSTGHTIDVIDLHGERQVRISLPGYNAFGPAWSPDGEWLVFSAGKGGPHADLFVARADGSDVHRVTDTPDNEIDVDWAPAG